MKNVIIMLLAVFTMSAAFGQKNSVHKINHYQRLVGKWEGAGFITDAYGNRQDVNATQWISIKNDIAVVNGVFENSATGFKANFLKQFYYHYKLQRWHMKVYVENKYFLTTKLSLSDNYTLIYTFKDEKGLMNRATIYAANPYGWTEMLETWNGTNWDIKRRIFMRKMETPKVVPKSLVRPAYRPPY